MSSSKVLHATQTYDGGISEAPFHEAHGGFTYCAIAALSFLDRLPLGHSQNPTATYSVPGDKLSGIVDLDLTLHWLVYRQTATLDEEDDFDTHADETDTPATCHDAHSFVTMNQFASKRGEESYKDRPTSHFELQWAGFNGRCNKIADTCYSFWVLGSLANLNKLYLANLDANRKYLLERTTHFIGGFGKHPGDPPDVYHSYLGLAALAIGSDCSPPDVNLKQLAPAVCMSVEACKRLANLPWRKEISPREPRIFDMYVENSGTNGTATSKQTAPTVPAQAEPAANGHGASRPNAHMSNMDYVAMTGG